MLPPQSLIDSLSIRVFFITQVDYDENNRHIAEVKIKFFTEDGQMTAIIKRELVVQILEKEVPVLVAGSAFQDVDLAEVQIYPLNGKDYIRTTPSDASCDNLGKLPGITRQ